MKMPISLLMTFLICALFAGCVSNQDLQDTLPAQTETLETVFASDQTVHVPIKEPTQAADELTVPFVVKVRPVISEQQKQVTVTTADEFLAAIAPGMEIIVDAKLIDLSTASGYGEIDGDYYYWEDTHDGPELFISEVSDLTIRGNGKERTANVISSVPRYSNVLNFFNCSNIMVKGLTVGHTEKDGECVGGVLRFLNSQNILVEECGLFGCGTVGVGAESSRDIQIINNEIYDCTVGGIDLSFCENVNADGNTFRNLGIFTFRVYDCGSVTCNGEPVFDSYRGY